MSIVDRGAVTLSGALDLNVSGTAVSLDIAEGVISWKNGLEVYLDALLSINGVQQRIFFQTNGKDFKFSYGAASEAIGLDIQSGEIHKLTDAFNELLDRVNAMIEKAIIEGTPTDELEEISSYLEGVLELEKIMNMGEAI